MTILDLAAMRWRQPFVSEALAFAKRSFTLAADFCSQELHSVVSKSKCPLFVASEMSGVGFKGVASPTL
jgi:hypothetical protein